MPRVSVEFANHIAHVTLTRGDKMNALDQAMLDGIIEAGENLRGKEGLRAVVVSGEGDAFCAGLDVMSFAGFAGQDPEALLMPRTHGMSNTFQRVCTVWRELEVPVIAALHGVCYGGGMQIALGADIRIAAPQTKLSIMEMKWGLIPDMGGMVVLPNLMRSDDMRKLIYTAEPILADDAQRMGLVTELAEDPLARAQELATEIAGKSPSAMRAAKALIDFAESGASVADVLLEESRVQASLIGKPEQMEVVMANMQKRPPKF
ncbi:crotonase/enoyl-CoA hydratase family protein [Cognatishimia sp.]|uniref:crotonase/enoyl-CoA hydratase family protein n=1 Tax=Cognatishimia sp. TaxID=2211648 RepID=UPI003511B50A